MHTEQQSNIYLMKICEFFFRATYHLNSYCKLHYVPILTSNARNISNVETSIAQES